MCMGSKTPKVETPPPVQAAKQPEVQALKERSKMSRSSASMGGGSLLTGATGIAPTSVSTGKTSLLGG